MREYVFEPYGMATSSYTWQPRFDEDYAFGRKSDGSVYPWDKDDSPRAPSIDARHEMFRP